MAPTHLAQQCLPEVSTIVILSLLWKGDKLIGCRANFCRTASFTAFGVQEPLSLINENQS